MASTVSKRSFKSFEESTRADWDVISPQLEVTQSMVADRILEQLSYLAGDDGGFPISRLEHSLQTASRAERDGRDEEYVVCALLHDIGDTLAPYNHPQIGAAILKPFVSEANHWMVAHHGIFQGYYFWHHIGLDRNARDAFRDSSYFDHTVEFCALYDQRAFDADYLSAPLDYYAPILRRFFAPRGGAVELQRMSSVQE